MYVMKDMLWMITALFGVGCHPIVAIAMLDLVA